jgi:hypothetical protein
MPGSVGPGASARSAEPSGARDVSVLPPPLTLTASERARATALAVAIALFALVLCVAVGVLLAAAFFPGSVAILGETIFLS